MKPQDIMVLLKLLLWKDGRWSVAGIAGTIGLSAAETHAAIKRSEKSGLYSPLTRKPVSSALRDFLIYGLKYCFPAEIGTLDRGMPTAHSAPPLSDMLSGLENEQYIWPDPKGKVRGLTVKPLYKSVPAAAANDKELYEYLALIDALRIGRAREKNLAEKILIDRLKIGES